MEQPEGLISRISESGLTSRNEREYKTRLSTKKSDAVARFVREHLGDREFIFMYPKDVSCTSLIPGLDPRYRYLVGSCLRRMFLDRFSIPRTDKESVAFLRRKQVGKNVETAERENISEAGFCQYANKKFVFIPYKDSSFVLSGEIDLIVKQQTVQQASSGLSELLGIARTLDAMQQYSCIVEVKSFYGYDAKKEIFGNTRQEGEPKPEHALQLSLYIQACKAFLGQIPGYTLFLKEENGKLVEDKDCGINAVGGIVYYIDRGDCTSMEHIVTLGEYNHIIINNKDVTQLEGLSLECMYDNFDRLANHIITKTLPVRTAAYMYPEDQIEAMKSAGLISKTKMEKYEKNQAAIGDWQCRYCEYKKFCIGDTPWKQETVPEDNYITDQINLVLRNKEEELEHWKPTLIASLLTE